MLHLNKAAALLVSLAALALAGCGSSSDSDSDVSVDTAKAAAVASLAKAINAAVNSVETVVSDSTATNVVLGKSVMTIPLSARAQADVVNRFKKLSASSPALRAVTTARAVNGVTASTVTAASVTEDELKQYFGTATQVGNTITYTLNADTLCAGTDDPFTTNVNEETECRNEAKHYTLVQTVVDANTGTVTLKVDAAAPLVIGYSTNSVYLEIDLAGLKAAAIALGAASADLPPTMVGAVRLTVTVTNATAGAESAAIKLGITTAINVAGTATDGAYSLQMAVADKLFEIAADVAAKTATMTVGLGLVDFTFPTVDSLGAHPSLFHLGGLTGTFALNNTTETLTGTNVGITGDMKEDEDTSDSSSGSVLTLALFDFTVNGTTSVVKFTKALAFQATDDYVGTIDDGSFSASATASTEVQVINTTSPSTNMVIAGQVTITGTGVYADGGPITATSTNNPCFQESYLTNFGYAVVSCPP